MLFSYTYLRKGNFTFDEVQALSGPVRVLIDCGAFTNSKTKIHNILYPDGETKLVVTVDDYIRDCRQYLHGHVWQYIAMDVILRPKETERNLYQMTDAGLTPMPVLVDNEDVEKVADFMKVNEYICVAGGVSGNHPWIQNRYRQAYAISGEKAKIHALGMAKHPYIFHVPIYSGDSSTFASGQRFGNIILWDEKVGFINQRYRKFDIKQERTRRVLAELMRYGIDYKALTDPTNYRKTKSIPSFTSVFAYLRFWRYTMQRGYHFFFVVSNLAWLHTIIAVASTWDIENDVYNFPESVEIFSQLNSAPREQGLVMSLDIINKHIYPVVVNGSKEA